MSYVFSGGIFFKGDIDTESTSVTRPDVPDKLFLPIAKSSVRPALPVGARILRGQAALVYEDGTPAIHSHVSGVIAGIEDVGGQTRLVIENDGADEVFPGIRKMNKKLADCTSEEIIEKIRASGIVCADDGTDAADKLSSAVGKCDTCIINCAESEPYVSCDIAAASSSPAAVVNGLKIFMRALGIRRGVIAVPEGMQQAAKKLSSLTRGSRLITVETVTPKYPQGTERRLVYSVTGRELRPHTSPLSLGCVIFNVQTCTAVYEAFVTGMPVTERVVSVGGDCVREYVNVSVPIGTRFSELSEMAGGLRSKPHLILEGGPLRGVRASFDGVVSKTTRAVLFFNERSSSGESRSPACIRCGRCVAACPERLSPNYIYAYLRDGKTKDAVRMGALDCSGCGICSYVCPGKAPVKELIEEFKNSRAAGELAPSRGDKGGEADA